jgi:response regulator of citrate/malate metabolism
MTISTDRTSKILIVEDDTRVRNLIYRFLSQTYQVQLPQTTKLLSKFLTNLTRFS